MAETTAMTAPPKPIRRESRAVLRPVEAGSHVECAHCGDRVKFQAKLRQQQVICNIYIQGRWDRVEHYHVSCYDLAGEPAGAAA
jgi:hypothetical protein